MANPTVNLDWSANSTNPTGDYLSKDGNRPSGVLIDQATFFGNTIPASGVSGTLDQEPTWEYYYVDGFGTLSFSNNWAECAYPSSTGQEFLPALYNHQVNGLSELFVEADIRMSAAPRGGCKMFKVHGQEVATGNYANATFNLEYGTGRFEKISFGDGSTVANDAAAIIDFATGTANGRNAGTAVISCPVGQWDWPDTNWHKFRFHIKFNTGTSAASEVPDGEIHLYIDGQLICSATNIYNRHYSNPPIDYVSFFDVYQYSPNSFTMSMDNIKLSTGDWV